MSSNEEDINDPDSSANALNQSSKKRRIQRACDICRRKKIRCDGGQMPENKCSNCVTYNLSCTYVEAAKKRGPPKGYVESLENRVEKLETLLCRICPDKDILRELDNASDTLDPPNNPSPLVGSFSTSHTQPQGHMHPGDLATSALRKVSDAATSGNNQDEQDEDYAHLILADNLKRLSIDPAECRFFGKSSGAMLIQTAIELKNEYTGQDDQHLKNPMLGGKRPEYWTVRPWERSSAETQRPTYNFPPDDLVVMLIDLYFTNVNLYLPLLHRPTFDRSIAEGLHHTNEMFGATLLLVCAVGSRYSDDRRVLLDGEESFNSCGWKWFEQVQMVRRSLLAPPSLYDLQFICLSVQFLQGSSAPQACWTMVGIGIRLAQDVGAHRRKIQTKAWTAEDELWKRAFWVLVSMDRMVCCALGRPCAIQDEDFDIDMPFEVDDEYWEHSDPEMRFKQPADEPSLITAFNLYLKLNQVLAFSLRTIYSINKSKILLGFVGQQWEQHIVAELDSALNKWVDSVPDYLRWDPNRENDRFFQQSVALYVGYYHLQILIHRPFIPSPRKPSPLSFPSLAICTNAARSCSHIIDIQRKRVLIPPPQTQMAVFTAGIVLLLNIWGGKRSGLSTDPHKEMADVYKCMQVLRLSEQRWHMCGRLWDILYELASVGELPLPHSSPPSSNKRERDEDSLLTESTPSPVGPGELGTLTLTVPTVPLSMSSTSTSSSSLQEGPRMIVGSKRVQRMHPIQTQPQPSQSQQPQSQPPQSQPQVQAPPPQQQQHQQSQFYALPMYSDELGRLPLHGQVNFAMHAQPPPPPAPAGQSDYWFNEMAPSYSPASAPPQLHPDQAQGGMGYDPLVAALEFSSRAQRQGVHSHHVQQQQQPQPQRHQQHQQHPHPHSHRHQHPRSHGGHQLPSAAAPAPVGVFSPPLQSGMDGMDAMTLGASGAGTGYMGDRGYRGDLHGMQATATAMHMGGGVGGARPPQPQLHRQQRRHLEQGPLLSRSASLTNLSDLSSSSLPHQHQHQQQQQLQQQFVIDSDTMAMWSNAPTGFELDDWGTYLSNVCELTQGAHAAGVRQVR
ncbi:hypothetical protein AX17_006903 [Amanita inopinata Kibby_2008]|nr:hypothetical protein AX17_006903 [Amanita inopinata Kibby_2008]